MRSKSREKGTKFNNYVKSSADKENNAKSKS